MVNIAGADVSSDSLLNDDASNKILSRLKLQSSEHGPSVAFIAFNVWRRDEVGDANLFDEQVFTVRDGKVRFLDPHYEAEKFSPDGLSWGYRGSASAQLAIAMLMEVLDRDWNRVKPLWPAFQDEFVVRLPRDANWTADGSTVLAIALTLENQRNDRA